MTCMNCSRRAPCVLDVAGPGNAHALADAAELRGVLLEPGEGRIKRPGPARRHVVVGLLRAPDVVPLHLVGDRHHVDAIKECDFVRRAERTALGAGAVVAVDVDDERVVELAHVLDGLDDAADFVVVVGLIGGEDFDLLDKELLLLGRAIIPVLEDFGRPGLQLGCPPGSRRGVFWFSKIRSRSLFQPSSNRCMLWILSTHSLVG